MTHSTRRTFLTAAMFLAVASAATGSASAGTCFVSPTGNDGSASPSNRLTPLRTVAQALSRGSAACNPIVLLDGTYAERIKVQSRNEPSSAPLVIKADHPFTPGMAPGAGAIVDGGLVAIDPSMPRQAVVAIYDSSYVVVQGLRIRQNANLFCASVQPSSSFCNSAGLDVRDLSQTFGQPPVNGPSSHHITVVGNEIAEIRAATVKARLVTPNGGCSGAMLACTSGADCIRRYDAVPLSIYSARDGVNASGTADPAEATHHVVVEGNLFHHNDNNSDCNGNPVINVSTNVENVLVQSNTIRDIDATSAALPMSPGITVRGERYAGRSAVLEAAQRARKVVINHNAFLRIDGPALYVQSANNVLFELNSVRRTTLGVQVATEGAVAQPSAGAATRGRRVWIRDNLFRNVGAWAIDLGMQAPDYSPVEDVHVTNNSILTLQPSVATYLRYQIVLRDGVVGNSRVGNNLIRMRWPLATPTCTPTANGSVACDHLLLRSTSTTFPMTAVLDHNHWFVASYPGTFATAPLWCSLNGAISCLAFSAYQSAVEPSALASDPQLAQYRLASASPARNTGVATTPSWVSASGANPLGNFGDYAQQSAPETDYYGNPRVLGTAVDRGMEELR